MTDDLVDNIIFYGESDNTLYCLHKFELTHVLNYRVGCYYTVVSLFQ